MLQAVALELRTDIGGGDGFVAGGAAAALHGVAGQKGLMGADPLRLDLPGGFGPGGLRKGRSGADKCERGNTERAERR